MSALAGFFIMLGLFELAGAVRQVAEALRRKP
jgi:hypothetical protein